jgi:hypothetical protein
MMDTGTQRACEPKDLLRQFLLLRRPIQITLQYLLLITAVVMLEKLKMHLLHTE